MSIRILLVDDDDDDRELFRGAIEDIDPTIECIEANDGEKALELLLSDKKQRPDFIFLDLNMPRVNGFQCLKELKNNDNLKSIPVIIYTTSQRNEDKIKTRKMGAAYYITKPHRHADLRKVISYALEGKWAKIK